MKTQLLPLLVLLLLPGWAQAEAPYHQPLPPTRIIDVETNVDALETGGNSKATATNQFSGNSELQQFTTHNTQVRHAAGRAASLYTHFECQDVAASGQGFIGGGALAKSSEACQNLRSGMALLRFGTENNSPSLQLAGVGLIQNAEAIYQNRAHSFTNRCFGGVPFLTETAPGSGDTPLDYRWWKRCVAESLTLGLVDFKPKGGLVSAFQKEQANQGETWGSILPPTKDSKAVKVPEGWWTCVDDFCYGPKWSANQPLPGLPVIDRGESIFMGDLEPPTADK